MYFLVKKISISFIELINHFSFRKLIHLGWPFSIICSYLRWIRSHFLRLILFVQNSINQRMNGPRTLCWWLSHNKSFFLWKRFLISWCELILPPNNLIFSTLTKIYFLHIHIETGKPSPLFFNAKKLTPYKYGRDNNF